MVIILDIDGVMVHAISNESLEFEQDGFYKFNPEAVNALNKLFEHYDNDENEIILSTSHLNKYLPNQWCDILNARGLLHYLYLTRPLIEGNSKLEIINNIIDNRQLSVSELIIIDDDKSLSNLCAERKARLILTNPITGLVVDDVLSFINQSNGN